MLYSIGRTTLVQLQSLLRGFLQDGSFPFGSVLTVKDIVDLTSQEWTETCDRIFTPVVTLWTFWVKSTAIIPRAVQRSHVSTPRVSPRAWRRVRYAPADIARRANVCPSRRCTAAQLSCRPPRGGVVAGLWSRKWEKTHYTLPLLRLTCRPDQNQIVDNHPYRIALLDHQETCHWCSRSDTCVGIGRHRINVMRDDDQLMLGGVCEYFDIRALVHADITDADELDGWLATENAMHEMLVEVMISKKARAAHEASDTSAPLSARRRLTTGLACASASARNAFQSASCLCR